MKYKLIERGKPGDTSAPKKWYASPVYTEKVSLKKLAKEIAGRSSLTSGDVLNVINNLLDELPAYLMRGNRVQLGDFGSFRLSFSSEGVEVAKDFNTNKIKGVKVLYTPGKDIKNQLDDIHFEKE